MFQYDERSDSRFRAHYMVCWILYDGDVVIFCKIRKEAERFPVSQAILFIQKDKKDDILGRLDTFFSIYENAIEDIVIFVYLGKVASIKSRKIKSTTQQLAETVAKSNQSTQVLTEFNAKMSSRKKFVEACA